MREILFRGKTSNGEWVEGFYVCNRYSIGFAKEPVIYENHYIYAKRIDGEKWFKTIQVEVIPETVGQFTGLTDKNGKKIFEGDILQYIKYSEIKSEVSFDDGAFGFYYDRTHIVVAFSDSEEGVDAEDYEVIGNKWDNPELLGENK